MTDAAKLPLMLSELRMPTFGRLWQEIGERADREGWGAARFLAALCEHELAERATRDLQVGGVTVPEGTLLVLDVWGTNNDPRVWHEPRTFDPGRQARTPVTAYNLVPQGGGDRHTGHRCPGEDLTLVLLTELVPRLAELDLRVGNPGHHVGVGHHPTVGVDEAGALDAASAGAAAADLDH